MTTPALSAPTGEHQVIDIHCHPCLKTWLFPRHHVYDQVNPTNPDFSENCFVNIDQMQRGNVGIGVSVYYLPEAELETERMKNVLMTLAMAALKQFCGRLPQVVEDKTSGPSASFEQMKIYINTFIADIHTARGMGYNVDIATGYADLLTKVGNGTTMFLHSLEGAHCLGNVPITPLQVLDNLTYFFNIGVCQITLGHFFQNILVSSAGGIPPGLAEQLNYDPNDYNTFAGGYNGTLATGIIDQMLEMGIIIDLVHSHPGAKQMVYDRNNVRKVKRPLTFAHTGVREVALKHNPLMDPKYAKILPDSSDIRAIKDCGGVLGVIFMDYWLTGDDDHRNAIEAIIETMIFIRDVPDSQGNAGTYDHIAIGSDLDGFTTIPDDLLGERLMKDLVGAIAGISGITDDEVDNICWGNYMRVLKNGWGKA